MYCSASRLGISHRYARVDSNATHAARTVCHTCGAHSVPHMHARSVPHTRAVRLTRVHTRARTRTLHQHANVAWYLHAPRCSHGWRMLSRVLLPFPSAYACVRAPCSNSTMVSCDVRGYIRCNCQLSGTPDVTIVFNTPAVIEDCSFHPCVRYARWERESVVSFIPPDGVFTLMSYRVVDKSPSLPLAARPLVTWREGGGRASFTITQRPGFIRPTTMTGGAAGPTPDAGLDDVRLVVSLPKGVKSQDLSSDVGHVTVAPRTGDVTWSMRSLPRDRSPELAGNVYTAPGTPALLESLSATLHFTAHDQNLSGLAIRDIQLYNEKYKLFSGCKTLLKSGRVQIRT